MRNLLAVQKSSNDAKPREGIQVVNLERCPAQNVKREHPHQWRILRRLQPLILKIGGMLPIVYLIQIIELYAGEAG